MGAAENRAVLARWTRDEDHHDLSRLEDYMHDDVVVYQPGTETVVGIAAYRAMMQAAYTGLPDLRVVHDDEFATDDRVVCRWRISGTHSAESFGYRPTRRRLEFAGISAWDFDDGKARRGWMYSDVPAIMAQVGAWGLQVPRTATSAQSGPTLLAW
ncbi:MAG: hypothetical protein JWR37_1109 [Mycobacterium sp.]|jgi:predicted ester cyclase|nr:hypothetical protein [Mycobacterium sp.]